MNDQLLSINEDVTLVKVASVNRLAPTISTATHVKLKLSVVRQFVI